MKKIIELVIVLGMYLYASGVKASEKELLDFGFYQMEYSCEHKGFNWIQYETVPDNGELKRYKGFHREDKLPEHCRKKSTSTFKRPAGTTQYHRGHGVHSNLWDHSVKMMRATNTMANVVPHEAYQNVHGLWRYTEKLTECYRDLGTVNVWLGNVWGNDETNDHFVLSHGVTTPDFMWKVLVRSDGEINAWIIPNNRQATQYNAARYEVSVQKILDTVNYQVPGLEGLASHKISKTWWLPKGCSLR